jgi:hypothetical protein
MARSASRNLSVLLLLPLAACTTFPENVHQSGQAMVQWSDNGTALSAFVSVDPVACGEAGPELAIAGQVISSAAASFVEVVVEIDGVEQARHTLVESGAFDKQDGAKAAAIDSRIPLPLGEHSARLCLGQRGAKGRPEKGACLQPFDYAIDCQAVAPVDETRPTIVATRSAAPNENGWYKEPLVVTFTCSDAESGIESCSEPVVVDQDGLEQYAKGYAVDKAGNTFGRSEGPLRLDQAAPVITFPGVRDYLVDETIDVGCAIGDALSGVKESTCGAITGDAFRMPLGAHAISGHATDLAGNVTDTSAEFTVSVTSDSLCNLVERFVLKAGIAGSLCTKLDNAAASVARGNAKSANGLLDAFQHEVSAQSGKAITYAHAAVLIPLADGLRME